MKGVEKEGGDHDCLEISPRVGCNLADSDLGVRDVILSSRPPDQSPPWKWQFQENPMVKKNMEHWRGRCGERWVGCGDWRSLMV